MNDSQKNRALSRAVESKMQCKGRLATNCRETPYIETSVAKKTIIPFPYEFQVGLWFLTPDCRLELSEEF